MNMIEIEVIVLKPKEEATKEGGYRVQSLKSPGIPRKGDLFRLLGGRELSELHVVSDVLFEQRAEDGLSIAVFLKPQIVGEAHSSS